jgi:RNAse (barnase) inhibitor barstar
MSPSSSAVPEFDFTAAPPSGPRVQVVEIPAAATTRDQLFRALVEGLQLPGYFGWNFDALEECLTDLSWLPEQDDIVLLHHAVPLDPAYSYSRRIYLQVLRDAVATWSTRRPGRLRVIFPPASATEIATLLLAMT